MYLKLLTLVLVLPLLLPQGLCVCQSMPWLFEHEEIAIVATKSAEMTAVDMAKGCCHCHHDEVPQPNSNQTLNSHGLAPDAEQHTALFVEAAATPVSDLVLLNVTAELSTRTLATNQLLSRAAQISMHHIDSRTLAHISLRI
ncbi:hypothetical protein BH11PLA2_BH11PLA2_39700 [soil metagenome]